MMTRDVSWRGPRTAGLAVLTLGIVGLAATTAIPSARHGWAIDGPRFLPLVASLSLIALAGAHLARTVVRPDVDLARHAAAEAATTHWPTPSTLMALLVGYLLVLTPFGYALATAVFVPLSGRVLGSDRPIRDAMVGVVLGVVVCYAFTRWLGVRLPVGPWGV
jgi:putative tricarboxylic transport membrane protein